MADKNLAGLMGVVYLGCIIAYAYYKTARQAAS
jgi:hypothetical protein